MLAQTLHFPPYPHSLLEKLQQLSPFPSSLQPWLRGASSVPRLHFLCRAQVPHCPSCCCLFSGHAGAAPSLSPFPATGLLHLCFHFPLLFSTTFAFCREGTVPFWPRSFSFLPWCLPPCSCPCFFLFFCRRSSVL